MPAARLDARSSLTILGPAPKSGIALAEKGPNCPHVALVPEPAACLIDVYPRERVLGRPCRNVLESRLEEAVARAKRAFLSVAVLDGLTDRPDDLERPTALLQRLSEKGFHGRFAGFDAASREEQAAPRRNDGNPPTAGTDLGALALVYYPWILECTNNQYDQCHFPGYRVDDTWGGAAWIDAGGIRGILVFGLKGLGDNCSGDPGVECVSPACDPYRGWHSDPYQPQIIFYDPGDLVEVVAGTRQPWEVLPYATCQRQPYCSRLRPSVSGQSLYVSGIVHPRMW